MVPAGRNREVSCRGRACAFALALLLGLSGSAVAESLRIGGTGAALGTMELLAQAFMARNPDVRITTVPGLGSGGGTRAVIRAAIGLAVTSRPIDESERTLGAVEMEYARTPFVFAVSATSSLRAISSAELADIYAGKRTAWADGSPARVVLRPATDIDSVLVRNISPAMRQGLEAAQARPGVRLAVTDQNAADDLESIPGAIGPSSLALILSERRALRALPLDGIEPTPSNAAAGAYPYHKRLYFVTGAKRPAAVERFVEFVHSAAGREILAGNGQWVP